MASATEHDWHAHAARAAGELRHNPQAVDTIGGVVLNDLPQLASSASMRREFDMSLVGNVETTLRIYETGVDPRSVPLSDAQIQYARTLARHGVPLAALLNAYRLGQSAFMSLWSRNLAANVTHSQTLASLIGRSSGMLDQYFIRATQSAIDAYESERDRVTHDSADELSRLTEVLAESGCTGEISEVNGYRLSGRHIGVVLLADHAAADGVDTSGETVRAMATALSAQKTYWVTSTPNCTWAWLGDPRVLGVEDMRTRCESVLPQGMRAAFGRPGTGHGGFVSTHRQAKNVASIIDRIQGPSCWYDELEIALLVSGVPEVVNDFVDGQLNGLAATCATTAPLRETVRVFLEERGSARRTAERMFLHRNSVMYRIRSAEKLLGRRVADGDTLSLQLALHLANLPIDFGTPISSLPS